MTTLTRILFALAALIALAAVGTWLGHSQLSTLNSELSLIP